MNGSHRKFTISSLVLIFTIVALIAPQTTNSQLNSNTASVVVTATLLEALTLTATPRTTSNQHADLKGA